MTRWPRPQPPPSVVWAVAPLALVATMSLAQSPGTPPASSGPDTSRAGQTTPSPPSPSSGIRNKLSAGDLLSAESILEVHRDRNGEDGAYLSGLAWLARGALLVGDFEKADRYAADVRRRCADSLAHGTDPEKNPVVEIALGAAIEVKAQRLERTQGAPAAVAYVRSELAGIKGPVSLRTRLNKRINMMTLTGAPAPELVVEDFLGAPPPSLASLRGRPVLLFLWAEWCNDCKVQEATLARIHSRYVGRGLQTIAITRYYEDDVTKQPREKAKVDSVWKAVYRTGLGDLPIVMSTASYERYGASSTPTFVFIDREGIVRRYTPTRLTEAEFDRTLTELLR